MSRTYRDRRISCVDYHLWAVRNELLEDDNQLQKTVALFYSDKNKYRYMLSPRWDRRRIIPKKEPVMSFVFKELNDSFDISAYNLLSTQMDMYWFDNDTDSDYDEFDFYENW
jgi:hypothetical protein